MAAEQPAAAVEPTTPECRPRSCTELFVAFTSLALQGFGGVLPIAQRELVERRRWLTRAGFVELLSTGQVLPGPNLVNVALIFGDRSFGLRGALAALAGMLLAPTLLVLALAALYAQFVHWAPVAGALRGMGAVAAGLVVGSAAKLAPSLRGNPLGRVACAAVMLATVAAMAALRWPLVSVILGFGAASTAFAWWRLARR